LSSWQLTGNDVDLNANGAIEAEDLTLTGTLFSRSPSDSYIIKVAGSGDLEADDAVQTEDLTPTEETYPENSSNPDTVEARDGMSDTSIPVAFNLENRADLAILAANLNQMAQTQACPVFACTEIIPHVVCISKVISAGGSWKQMWDSISQTCGTSAQQV
jgi:hypothetical protein